jgi:chromosome segregation ATPase
MRLGV